MIDANDFSGLRRLLTALRPFLAKLVIVGGWANRLYRFADDVEAPGYDPIFTTDTDIALIDARAFEPNSIRERLRENGFVEELRGEDRPPITHYHIGDTASPFYAEFLTTMRNSRRSSPDTVVVGGVVAQSLRDVDILLIQPWSLRFSDPADGSEFVILVPNPVSYMVQKLVVLHRRPARDRAKDILYIHDTLDLFGAQLDRLTGIWKQAVRPQIGNRAAKARQLAAGYFTNTTDDIRGAALVAGGRVDAETIRLRCSVGLSRLMA